MKFDKDLSDLAYAMRIATEAAQQQIASLNEPRALADCIRCQLIETTISAFLDGYIPELIAQALTVDLWSPELAINITSRIPDKSNRTHLCVDLLHSGKLNTEQRRSVVQIALQAIPDIPFEDSFVPAYSGIIPYADAAQREQTLQMALAMSREKDRACVLRDLVPRLPDHALEKVIQVTQAMEDPGNQAIVLSTLLPHLPVEQQRSMLQHALERSYESYDEFNDEKTWYTTPPEVIAQIALVVTGETLSLVLQSVDGIPDRAAQVEMLCNLISYMPQEQQHAHIEEALELAQEHWQTYDKRNDLFMLQFETYRGIGNQWFYAVKPLAMIAQLLPEEQRAHLLEPPLAYALAAGNKAERASLLAGLCSGLIPAQRQGLLEDIAHSTLTAELEPWRTEILLELVPYLEGKALDIAPQALETILSQALDIDEVDLFCKLAPRFNSTQRTRILQAVLAMQEKWYQKKSLCALLPYLEGEQQTQTLRKTLQLLQDTYDWRDRKGYIYSLLSLIPRELLVEFLRPSSAKGYDEAEQARAITTMISHLADERRIPILERELQRTQTLPHEWEIAETLAALAPHLPDTLAQHALLLVTQIENDMTRTDSLGALAPCLHDKLVERAAEIALREKEGWRGYAITPLVIQMEEPLLLSTWQSLQGKDLSKELLLAMIPRLPQSQLGRALKATSALDEAARIEVFAVLIPRLSSQEALMRQIFQSIPDYRNSHFGAEVFFLLASHIPESLLPQAFSMINRLGYEEDRQQALGILRSRFTQQQPIQAMKQAAQDIKQNLPGIEGPGPAGSLLYSVSELLTDFLSSGILTDLKSASTQADFMALIRKEKQSAQGQPQARTDVPASASNEPEGNKDRAEQPLSRAALAQQWQAATEIKDPWERAQAFARLLPYFTNQKLLLKEIYSAMLAGLQPVPARSRKELLQKLSAPALFQPPLFSPETLFTIASHIHTICREWQWDKA
jgi:hypothetical protein